jgi:hypothetical protein
MPMALDEFIGSRGTKCANLKSREAWASETLRFLTMHSWRSWCGGCLLCQIRCVQRCSKPVVSSARTFSVLAALVGDRYHGGPFFTEGIC